MIDGKQIEPFIEAFGQNVDMISVNKSSTPSPIESKAPGEIDVKETDPQLENEISLVQSSPSFRIESIKFAGQKENAKLLEVDSKLSSSDASETIGTIITNDVEQGKCAPFRRIDITNGKRSINEPKHTPVSN